MVKTLGDTGDVGSIPGSGRSPGVGKPVAGFSFFLVRFDIIWPCVED